MVYGGDLPVSPLRESSNCWWMQFLEGWANWSSWHYLLAINRSEFTCGDRKWIVASWPEWTRESLLTDKQAAVSADGCPRGTECANYHLWFVWCLKVSDLMLGQKQLQRRLACKLGCKKKSHRLFSDAYILVSKADVMQDISQPA